MFYKNKITALQSRCTLLEARVLALELLLGKTKKGKKTSSLTTVACTDSRFNPKTKIVTRSLKK
jgi:hypothetical protein